jgi:GT2 family glycosyltransferase
MLHNCLINLINQNFNKREYEIIVVSDGPDQQTQKKVLECRCLSAAPLEYYSLDFKKGPAAARNKGWQKAQGILIAFTDDDCLPEKNWLKHIWDYYKQEREVVYTGRIIVPVSIAPTDFEANTARLETAEFVTANCICTKQAIEKVEGFDERFKAAWREDSDLHFKLLEHGIPIRKNEKAIVHHPVRKVSWGVSVREQKKSLYNALLYKKHPQLYRQRIKANPNWNYYLIIALFLVGTVLLISGLQKLSLIVFAAWIVSTVPFIMRRLKNTSHSFSHVTEMIATSFIIPFLSVFWTLYGALKYRVLFF